MNHQRYIVQEIEAEANNRHSNKIQTSNKEKSFNIHVFYAQKLHYNCSTIFTEVPAINSYYKILNNF